MPQLPAWASCGEKKDSRAESGPLSACPTAWGQKTNHFCLHDAGFYHRDEKDPHKKNFKKSSCSSSRLRDYTSVTPIFLSSKSWFNTAAEMWSQREDADKGAAESRLTWVSCEKSGSRPDKKEKWKTVKEETSPAASLIYWWSRFWQPETSSKTGCQFSKDTLFVV